MDAQEQLFGLIAAAQEQQKAVKTALDGLTQERKALVTAISAAKDAIPALKTALGDAASMAVEGSLGKAPEAAKNALKTATDALADAGTDLRNASQWLGVKFIIAFTFTGLVLIAALYGVGRWILPSPADIAELRTEKAALEANVADLARKGGRIKLSECGGRVCIEASSNQGKDYPDWKGPWKDRATGVALVVPRGY